MDNFWKPPRAAVRVINRTKIEHLIKEYWKKIKSLSMLELLEEWDKARQSVNPDCTIWDADGFTLPKRKIYGNDKPEEVKKIKVLRKCTECKYCTKITRPTGRHEWLCMHPETEGNTICLSKKTGEMIVKTSPKWCPREED